MTFLHDVPVQLVQEKNERQAFMPSYHASYFIACVYNAVYCALTGCNALDVNIKCQSL